MKVKTKYQNDNGVFYINEDGTIEVDFDSIKDSVQLYKDIEKAIREHRDSHMLLEKRETNIKSILDK